MLRRERRLHRRVLVELVQHDVAGWRRAQLDHEARSSPDDSLRTSRMPSMRRSFTSSAIFWPITSTDVWYGTLGDDDARLAALAFVDLGDRAHLDGAATGRVRVADPSLPRMSAPVGKSGPSRSS
jgi:hypothetical protein